MNTSAKLLLKVFSISFLSLMVIRGINKSSNKDFTISVKNSLETSFLIPVIIYILNI
jgi:hypothetical protein